MSPQDEGPRIEAAIASLIERQNDETRTYRDEQAKRMSEKFDKLQETQTRYQAWMEELSKESREMSKKVNGLDLKISKHIAIYEESKSNAQTNKKMFWITVTALGTLGAVVVGMLNFHFG